MKTAGAALFPSSLSLRMSKIQPLDLDALCVRLEASLRDAIACIDRNRRGIALIVDEARRLLGTITDGDVRRAMLAGKTLETTVGALHALKETSTRYAHPVTAPHGTDHATLLQIMRTQAVRQVPLLDSAGSVAGLVTFEDLVPDEPLAVQAVIMAGGFGTRLMPLTQDTPKPMLPIGDRPIMEHIIDQLRQCGIYRVNVTTHYHREKIKSHFGDGKQLGVQLKYVDEDRPLGTAGALSLMEAPDEPILVINGDILTQVDFRDMLQFHREQKADLTVAVRKYDFQVPYGVVECDEFAVRKLTEKPEFSFFVNAGIYLLEPSLHDLIPTGEAFNMTDLIQRMLETNRSVVSFPVREYWFDIGQHSDYEQAQLHEKNRTPA